MANPNRFFLGTSTPRETHDLLRALVAGTLLSPPRPTYLLGMLRSPVAFTDGIRRTMSSDERARIATKAGWYADARHEAGVIFDRAGAAGADVRALRRRPGRPGRLRRDPPGGAGPGRHGPLFLAAVDADRGRRARRSGSPPDAPATAARDPSVRVGRRCR